MWQSFMHKAVTIGSNPMCHLYVLRLDQKQSYATFSDPIEANLIRAVC